MKVDPYMVYAFDQIGEINMKKTIPIILLLVAALMLSACGANIHIGSSKVVTGSGNVVTSEVSVSGFDAVQLDSIGDLTITQGDTESLSIEAEDNILDVLESKVSGKTLVLGSQDNVTLTPTKPIRYTLTVKDLASVKLAGLGNVSMDGLKTGRLDLNISGSGNLTLLGLQAESVDVAISGLGSVELTGQASALRLEMEGSGNCRAGDLAVRDAEINISGLGNATLWASDSLDIRISGAGNLEYYGSPRVSQEISGVGSIKSLGEK